eukprot:ANDGO_00158.mRNA.1 Sec14 cytosolic factor
MSLGSDIKKEEVLRETVNIGEVAEFLGHGECKRDGAWKKAIIAVQDLMVYVSEDLEHDPFISAALNKSTSVQSVPYAVATKDNCTEVTTMSQKIWFSFKKAEDLARWNEFLTLKLSTVGTVSEEESQKLEIVEKGLNEKAKNAKLSKSDLLRFLRGNESNVDLTIVQANECVLWRERYGVDRLTIAHVRKEFEAGYSYWIPGVYDVQGRPIVVFEFGKFQPKKTTPLEAIKLVIYLMERAIETMPPGVESICLLCDCTNMSSANFDDKMERMGFDVVKRYYPGRIGAMVVTNAPMSFRIVWKVMTLWLSKEFTRICHVFKHSPAEIPQLVDASSVPTSLGGYFKWEPSDFFAARCKAEQVDPNAKVVQVMDAGMVENLRLSETCPADIKGAQKKGFMTKKGGVVKNWKRRLFVLKDSCLAYYKEESSTEAQGVVLLERSWVERTDDDKYFKICTPLRTYEIKCDSADECDAWISAIDTQCKKATDL